MPRKILLTIVLAAALFLVAACNDDDECVNCPGTSAPYLTMANIWPHADGTAWTFDLEYRELKPNPEGAGKVGEVPSFEELHAALQEPMDGVVTDEGKGLFRFAFDGTLTTQSGVEAQRVLKTFSLDRPDSYSNTGRNTPTVSDRTMAMIAQARPDLRPDLVARYGLDEKSLENAGPPFFLGGYAFAYEDSGYYGYGDLGQTHTWVYLEGDLTTGSEFEIQLFPGLVEDLWLRGRVWSVGRRTIGGRTYYNVLEYMYVLDFGEVYFRTAYGTSEGPFHPYYYGYSLFVPGLGPVAGIERRVLVPDDNLQEAVVPMVEYVMDLVDVTFP